MDIKSLLSTLPSANKDAKRIALFTAAVAKKTVDIINSGDDTRAFLEASSSLVYQWIDRSRKLSLADLFRDPFKSLREETRRFAVEWELDSVLRDVLG